MAEIVVGIDPGFEGAIAALNLDGTFAWVRDMPVRGTEGRGRELDLLALVSLGREIAGSRVWCEWPTTRPGEAPESSKRFGVGMGQVEGVFAANDCTVTRLPPATWKMGLGLAGKARNPHDARELAVAAAVRITGAPESELRGPRGAPLDGRAEALLIAWYGYTGTVDGLRQLSLDAREARLLLGNGKRRRGSYRG